MHNWISFQQTEMWLHKIFEKVLSRENVKFTIFTQIDNKKAKNKRKNFNIFSKLVNFVQLFRGISTID